MEQRTASQLAAKERRLQQLQRTVADLQGRLMAALERNALACACCDLCSVPHSAVSMVCSYGGRSHCVDLRNRQFHRRHRPDETWALNTASCQNLWLRQQWPWFSSVARQTCRQVKSNMCLEYILFASKDQRSKSIEIFE